MFYRHQSNRPEPHAYTPDGFVRNPIMNIHDIPSRRYPRVRGLALEVLTHADLAVAAGGLVHGAGAAIGLALLYPGQALRVLGGAPGAIGDVLIGSGAAASWTASGLGDAIRVVERPPD